MTTFVIEFWGIMVFAAMTVNSPSDEVPGKRIIMPDGTRGTYQGQSVDKHLSFIAFPANSAVMSGDWGTAMDFKPIDGWVYYPLKGVHLSFGVDGPLTLDPTYDLSLPKINTRCPGFGRLHPKFLDRTRVEGKDATVDIAAGMLSSELNSDTGSVTSRLILTESKLVITAKPHDNGPARAVTFAASTDIVIGNEPEKYLTTGMYPKGDNHFLIYYGMSKTPNYCTRIPPARSIGGNENAHGVKDVVGAHGACSNTGYP